ncbi:MAG: GNAT family N-acetyltransferase [Terriglobales bacterium]
MGFIPESHTAAKISHQPREYRPGESEQIANFFSNFSGPSTPATVEYRNWKYEINPFGRPVLHLIEIGNDIAGIVSVVPKPLRVRGEAVRGGELGDVYTHPAHQRKGISGTLLRSTIESALAAQLSIVYGVPNEIALPGELKVGYELCPYAQVQKLFLPLDWAAVMATRAKSGALATALGLPMRLMASLRHSRPRLRHSVLTASDVPDGMDSFWERSCSRFDFLIDRTPTYLDWRFFKHSKKREYRFQIVRDGQKVVAYSVSTIASAGQLVHGHIVDYFCDESFPEALESLLANLLQEFSLAGVHGVHLWTVASEAAWFRRFGFLLRGEKPIISYGNEAGKELARSQLRWFFTEGDSDNI